MPPQPIIFHTTGRERADCAISALAMYLGYSYEDVLREAAVKDEEGRGKFGLLIEEIIAIARKLGTKLTFKKDVDLDNDYGILSLPDHVNILRNGLIIDPDGTIWDVYDYLAYYKMEDHVEGILK